MKRRFLKSHSTNSKKKVFISQKAQCTYLFGHLKGKTVFYKQMLDFYLSKFYATHRNMKFCQNQWSLILISSLFQAPAHLILKIIKYFLREQVSDPNPHSVSYWYCISLIPIQIRIRQRDANINGSRSGSEKLMTYTDFGQGKVCGVISQTPLSIPGFQSFHVCNEVGEPQLDLFVLGLQLCQLCPQLKKRYGYYLLG